MALYKGTIQQKSLFTFLTLTAMTVLVCIAAFWQTSELNNQNAKLLRFERSYGAFRKYSTALKQIARGSYSIALGHFTKGAELITTGKATADTALIEFQNTDSNYLNGLRVNDQRLRNISNEFLAIAAAKGRGFAEQSPKINLKLDAIQEVGDSIRTTEAQIESDLDTTLGTMANEHYHVTLVANAWFLVACLTSVLLTVVLGTVFSKNITSRITELIAGARKVSHGKYERIRLGNANDELSELAATFNQMVDDLVRTKNYSDSVLESMSDMLFILNASDEIEQTNHAVMRDLQYSQEELLGKPLMQIFSADTDLLTLGSKLKLQRSQGFVADVVSKAGVNFPVSVSTALIRSQDGRTARVMVVKDMSEYKKRVESEAVAKVEREKAAQLTALNDKLVTTQVQLVQTSKFASLGEMAGGIAHEINNPLAIIHGNAGAIKELAETPDPDLGLVRLLSERIENTTMRISKIIRGLRSFARDGEADPFDESNVTQIVNEVVDLCRERLAHQSVVLTVEPFPDSLVIECREIQIVQIIMNLVNNARDAIEELPDKWVRLCVQDAGDFVEICVSDSGSGVPEKIREKIFQPFFTTKELGKGTGLGLSISKGIVESHRGALFYDSFSPNTRFIVRLPKLQTKARAA